MGSDAHSRGVSKNAREYFEKAVDYIGLEESDKFIIKKD
jgi:PHP family Zn ribbon phosphoesterase